MSAAGAGLEGYFVALNLTAETGHARLVHIAGVDAEPILEMEFDQTLGWLSCAVEMAHAAVRGLVWSRR